MKDSIELSSTAAEALTSAFAQDFNGVESLERMAWMVLVLKKTPDIEAIFPRGKWATIQSIEGQLDDAAEDYVFAFDFSKGGK